jgi:hypothetical protein
MSQHAHLQTTLARTFQLRREEGSLLVLATLHREPCIPPSTSSPRSRSFAYSGARHRRGPFGVVIPRPAFAAEFTDQQAQEFAAVWLRRHPYIDALQMSVSIERHLSRIFPAHPRSLASVLIPRHITPSRKGRGPWRFCGTSGSAFFGLLPQPGALGPRSKKCTLGLGSGAHSRRFAQECPEGNPGKFKQEKFQWHSTKTT